ncbi:unnamed protein product [Ilex paraguariensis]|uniref:Uncharacterized protein n=1 Tax=Ilex paraguariensis TaxID=185542 RepID=A0ABC8RUL8_9AQUA
MPNMQSENFSIIHGYDGRSFQRHYVNQDFGNSIFFSKTHKYRLQCYYVEPGALINKFNVSCYWKLHRYLRRDHWLASWLRREIQALIQEENVEIIVHHIVGVVDSLKRKEHKSSGNTPEAKQEEFKTLVSQAARPFLTGRTDRFVIELELFLASGLNIEAYDRVYIQHLGWKIPEITGEDEAGEFHAHEPSVPSLYFFDEDSNGNE